MRSTIAVRSAAALWLVTSACGGTAERGAGGAASSEATTGTGGAASSSAGTGGAGTGGVGTSSAATGGAGSACTDPSAKACNGPGECVLTAPGCCVCGMPELQDFVALNEESAPGCVCAGPVCDCVAVENPNLAASCVSGACVGWDVRVNEYSACTSDAECRLRFELGCCEPCSGGEGQLVAIRVDAEPKLKAAQCKPDEACSKCAVQYPPTAAATCIAGHCAVALAN